MIAANGVVATTAGKSFFVAPHRENSRALGRHRATGSCARREPARQPDSKALNDFLLKRKAADPDHFADLSLAVIKLIGPGEYVLERPGDPAQGHFGLAVQDYTHSTAPNRRFADLVTQRLIKASARRKTRALLRQRSRRHRLKLHRERRRGAKSGAGNVEAVGRHCDEPSRWVKPSTPLSPESLQREHLSASCSRTSKDCWRRERRGCTLATSCGQSCYGLTCNMGLLISPGLRRSILS